MKVETTDRYDASAGVLEQLQNRRSTFGITQRADHAPWLMQHDVDQLFSDDLVAVHLDTARAGIDLGAQLTHDFAVNAHTAGQNNLFGRPARRNPGLSQHLLKPFHLAPSVARDPAIGSPSSYFSRKIAYSRPTPPNRLAKSSATATAKRELDRLHPHLGESRSRSKWKTGVKQTRRGRAPIACQVN